MRFIFFFCMYKKYIMDTVPKHILLHTWFDKHGTFLRIEHTQHKLDEYITLLKNTYLDNYFKEFYFQETVSSTFLKRITEYALLLLNASDIVTIPDAGIICKIDCNKSDIDNLEKFILQNLTPPLAMSYFTKPIQNITVSKSVIECIPTEDDNRSAYEIYNKKACIDQTYNLKVIKGCDPIGSKYVINMQTFTDIIKGVVSHFDESHKTFDITPQKPNMITFDDLNTIIIDSLELELNDANVRWCLGKIFESYDYNTIEQNVFTHAYQDVNQLLSSHRWIEKQCPYDFIEFLNGDTILHMKETRPLPKYKCDGLHLPKVDVELPLPKVENQMDLYFETLVKNKINWFDKPGDDENIPICQKTVILENMLTHDKCIQSHDIILPEFKILHTLQGSCEIIKAKIENINAFFRGMFQDQTELWNMIDAIRITKYGTS